MNAAKPLDAVKSYIPPHTCQVKWKVSLATIFAIRGLNLTQNFIQSCIGLNGENLSPNCAIQFLNGIQACFTDTLACGRELAYRNKAGMQYSR